MIHDVAVIPDSNDAASWVIEGIQGFVDSVLSFVPGGFDAYARVFHPAVPHGSHRNLRPGERPLTWAEVAASMGTTAHAAMDWPSMIGTYRQAGSIPGAPNHPGVEPTSGALPIEVSRPLVEALREETGTPERCWFAVWEGFGALSSWVEGAPTFDLPHRRYHLLVGPIETIFESVEDPPFDQSANLWWPDDRSWCVATEIDLNTTYVGGSRQCVDRLLGESGLEVYEVAPSDLGDYVNPEPTDQPWRDPPPKRRRWRWRRRGRSTTMVAQARRRPDRP
ncbi:MAG TPA: hypothetical protein VII76_13155 [Acidimicrobiales bacterium]